MRLLSRSTFLEAISTTVLGTVLFTFVLFLRQIEKLFDILVHSSATPFEVGRLFVLAIPFTFPFTIPLGVLVGILIALSRMASDGEITAMRASGVPARIVTAPILLLAVIGFTITATSTLWLTPWSLWETDRTLHDLVAAQVTADVMPRVFDEDFPNRVLYVGEVTPGTVPRWRNVFIADLSPASADRSKVIERGDAPRITVAASALAVPDTVHNRIQLSMQDGSTHVVGRDINDYTWDRFRHSEQQLDAQKPGDVRIAKEIKEMDTIPLYRLAYVKRGIDIDQRTDARIEFHQRLALPPACILLALLGIPLGVSSRKGGKSTAFVLTIALAFLYYMALITLVGLARQRTIPVPLAVWAPDVAFALLGAILLARLERPGDRDWIAVVRNWFASFIDSLRGAVPIAGGRFRPGMVRLPLMPQLVDTYVLSAFVFYLVVVLAGFVAMVEVFTFFELLSDILKNHVPMSHVLEYLFYLGPKLIYDSAPVSVLVAVLITLGILAKHNEVTAFKACGVSLYRLAIPLLLAGIVLSGALFAFDHYYIPGANRRQDALRNEIKGRPVQTWLRPDKKWMLGKGSRIYYYLYFDPVKHVMAGVHVYELDPSTFRLIRHISAERAYWEPALHAWVYENGWSRDLVNGLERLNDFRGRATTFAELDEGPDYFLKEEVPSRQMNFRQLEAYIAELQQSGFDTGPLQVQFYRKFSVPLFALIMALISIPFAFLTGNRGAMAGVGVSLAIAFTYFAVSSLFEQVGDVSLLPAAAAAWAPDALFALAGLYFLTRMET
ncbi:MAG TPA: LptF/LptG family permease [Bryobacteraceae bacterium]|nr:LptF/LptG family permease [Bryobacteraceae bacterium]